MIAGCGADLLINICLTLLGYVSLHTSQFFASKPGYDTYSSSYQIPGHIHAFYLEYIYFDRREKSRLGQLTADPAPGVYSDRVQSGGTHGYGTI